VEDLDLPGLLRRVRREADLSQRELAERIGVSPAAIGHAEAGRRDLPAGVLARAARLAGLRVALLDEGGREVTGMTADSVRDAAGRHYPAHLDPRNGDDGWWYAGDRRPRPTPWYTFDRARWLRDADREHSGTPLDHRLPDPGDDPRDRDDQRRAVASERRRAAAVLRLEAARVLPWNDPPCECPPGCDATRDVLADVHVPDCPCRCDVS
jgi:HTH-type transcriptional regulator/antitoxin HipB